MTHLLARAIGAATLAAFGAAASADSHGADLRYVLVSHAPDTDSWWNTIKNGLALASYQMEVEVEYRNPPTGDLAEMARIIEEVAATKPDGIVTTLADYALLSGPVRAATEAGIDVIIMNSGTPEQAREVGALMFVGQPEYDAGYAAGMRAKAEGVESFVCVNHAIAVTVVAERCRGFADAIGATHPESMLDAGNEAAEIVARVTSHLEANPGTDAVLTLGPTSADPTILALQEMGLAGETYFGTFDLGPEIVKAIKAGTIDWGIDQQPFLQAYMPIVFLANHDRYGVLPGGDFNSGPGFVTRDALEKIEEYGGEYR